MGAKWAAQEKKRIAEEAASADKTEKRDNE